MKIRGRGIIVLYIHMHIHIHVVLALFYLFETRFLKVALADVKFGETSLTLLGVFGLKACTITPSFKLIFEDQILFLCCEDV